MNIGYNHIRKGQAEDPNPLLLTVSNPTIACADVEVTIQEPVADIVEAGVIGYRTIVSNPDAVSYDDKVVIDTPVQGSNTISGADLSLLSYDSITDTSTKNFYTYAYVKYSDGSYKYSDMQTNTFAPNTLSNNLEAYYSLDGNANDLTGNGHDGTVEGAVDSSGKINQGFDFDGSNDRIIISDNLDVNNILPFNSGMSMTAWFKPESSGGSQIISIHSNQGTSAERNYIMITLNDDTVRIELKGEGGSIPSGPKSAPGSVNVGSYNYSTLVRENDGVTYSLYLNGESVGSFSTYQFSNVTKPQTLQISGYTSEGGTRHGFFDGVIDEAGIYSKGINECEHKLLYKKGQGLPYA